MRIDTTSLIPTTRRLAALLILALLSLPILSAQAQDDSFTVTVGDKTDDHPNNPDEGFPSAYYIDGEEARVLTLERGVTYTFQMQDVPGIHPFYISTSADGRGAGEYTEGVTGSMATGNETLTFTPSESTPDLLYYQCGSHLYMGWQINVVDAAETEAFTAALSGDQAVPANASTGEGSVTAELDGSTLTVTGSFSGLTSDFNPDIAGGAHLHLALAGQNGGVDIPLNASVSDDGHSGTFEAADNTFTLDEDQTAALRARRYYVNIHTQDMPAGELRGQLLGEGATVHHAVLSGRAAVPANASDGVGGVLLELQDDELVVSGAFSDLDSDFNADAAGGAHLHLAPVGENGGIEIPLTPSINEDDRSGTFEASDNTFTLTADQQQALLDGELYVNIHTQDIPAGELRGQALPLSQRVFEASLSSNNAVPAVETPAMGGVLAVLDEESGELTVTGDFSGLASDFNADAAGGAHLHLAPVGENGGIEIPLTPSINEDDRSGTFEASDNTFTLTADQQQALLDGELYVNIHSQDVPSGEIRGQVLPSTNVAPSAAEITTPETDTTVTLDGTAEDFVVEWSGGGDPNFNDVLYRWQVATDEVFERPFYTAATTDAMLTLTPDSLRSVLMAAGFGAGQVDTVYHRIVALDGSQWNASDPMMLGFELGVPDFARAVELAEVAQGLTAPVALVEPPDDSGRLFVVDQAGQIRIVSADGTLQAEPFIDLTDRMVELMENFDERGLLGLAFHPDYATNGRFFVYYSAPLRDEAPDDWNHTSHVSEFMVSADDPDRADPDSEQILLQVDQPQFNHDAGTVAFGPEDGYLYISLGDGGGANDTPMGHVDDWYDFNDGGNGQDVEQNLLGSILRVDVDANVDTGDPYGIPQDNPFVGRDGMDEIYAYGFRNPYRFSFDQGGEHMLLVGDVGQGRWEEVSVVEQGGNYGWNVYEGTHCFDAANSNMDASDCPTMVGEGHPDAGEPLLGPVIEYANSNQGSGLGVAVVGGYVYRGSAIPELEGRYVFGDWSSSFGQPSGHLFVADPSDSGLWPIERLHVSGDPEGDLGHFLLGIGQDRDGELYALTTDQAGPTGTTGMVFRLEDAGPVSTEPGVERPTTLALDPAYPNPFTRETTVQMHAAEAGPVAVTVYDVLGREVKTLLDATVQPNTYRLTWDGTDVSGQQASSGIYFVQVRSNGAVQTRAVTLVR